MKHKKRIMQAIVLGVFLLTLTGLCSEGETIAQTENEYSSFPELDYVLGEREFYDLIENNPIDADMKWEDVGTEPRINFAADYRDAWLAEIEHAFDILQMYLSEEDYAILYSSYENWQAYMAGELVVEQKIYYPGSEYMNDENYAGAGMYYPIVMEREANRTKEYAVELLSLEYAMTGKVDFIYEQGKNADIWKEQLCGEWLVVEYLGSAVEYHGAEPETSEEKEMAEEYDMAVEEQYLGSTIRLTEENVAWFAAPCEMGYYYEDYEELFSLYRQPHTMNIAPPFTCVDASLKDMEDSIGIIIDANDMVVICVKGNFFRMEKQI